MGYLFAPVHVIIYVTKRFDNFTTVSSCLGYDLKETFFFQVVCETFLRVGNTSFLSFFSKLAFAISPPKPQFVGFSFAYELISKTSVAK